MTATALTEHAATGSRVHIAVDSLLEHVPATALAALAAATQADILDRPDILDRGTLVPDAITSWETDLPAVDALGSLYDGWARHDTLALWAIWVETGLPPATTATLLATAGQDRSKARALTRLLLCGPSPADAAAWAATPPDEDTIALLLALRGYRPDAPTTKGLA